RVAPAATDAQPRALPESDLLGCKPDDAARHARDVRDLLLQLALHPERAALLAGADGRDLPADDGADHPDRAACRKADRRGRRPLAHGQWARSRRSVARAL